MTRIFVIYATKDFPLFERLKEQARSAKLAVEFDHTQVKQPWVPEWKAQSRARIYKCDGAIVLISRNTKEGAVGWEMGCAEEFGIPILGVYTEKDRAGSVPKEPLDWSVIDWNVPGIARFVQSLGKGSHASA